MLRAISVIGLLSFVIIPIASGQTNGAPLLRSIRIDGTPSLGGQFKIIFETTPYTSTVANFLATFRDSKRYASAGFRMDKLVVVSKTETDLFVTATSMLKVDDYTLDNFTLRFADKSEIECSAGGFPNDPNIYYYYPSSEASGVGTLKISIKN